MDNERIDHQGSSRRAKIVIRKCKKESLDDESSSSTSPKKVNGELIHSDDVEKEDSADNIKAVSPSKIRPHGTKTITITSVKRKRPQKESQTSPIHEVLEDEIKITDEGKSEESGKSEITSIEFKGFKKRIIAQSEKMLDSVIDTEEAEESIDPPEITDTIQSKSSYSEPERPASESTEESEEVSPKPKIIKFIKGKKKADDAQGESQAEYAQYLGLQPTMQFKCYRCGEKGFPSLLALNVHQRSCGVMRKSNFIANIQQDQMSPSDPNMLTNFRITRKVYLCSACGTYYENWNLFLHMRDVHKKHICLLCLAMFGVADKLADHLNGTHSIIESTFTSSDDFQNTYKGSFYLICCTCENMFNERDLYLSHECVKKDPTAKCTACGVKCGHYYTCPNSNAPRTVTANVSSSSTINVAMSSSTMVKYSGPTSKKKSEQTWQGKKGTVKRSLENDDDYDVSHAASFCHVDIGDEAGEKEKSGTDDQIDITEEDLPNELNGELFDKTATSELSEPTSTTINDPDSVTGSVEKESNVPDAILEKESQSNILQDAESTSKEHNTEELNINDDNKNDDDEIIKSAEKVIENTDNNEGGSVHDNDISDNSVENNENQSVENNENHSSLERVEESEALLEKSNTSTQDSPIGSLSAASDEPNKKKEDVVVDADTINNTMKNDDNTVTPLDNVEAIEEESSNIEENEDTSRESPKDLSSFESDSDKSGLVVDENPKRKMPAKQKGKNRKKKGKEDRLDKSETQLVTNEGTDMHFNIDSGRNEIEGEKENVSNNVCSETLDCVSDNIDAILLAKDDVPAMALTLEDKLQDASPQSVVKECVRTSCLNCVYCSHAVKIAVNGKQLALHLLAEHRYKPVKNNETIDDVIIQLKKSLDILDSMYFNTESYDSSDKSLNLPYDHTYECFQCQFMTRSHKELYVHKRKMHQKTVMLCVMCKSTFYSYSELLCHLCPGDNISEDIFFRCCFCNLDKIPSAFRLMVHLRKSHHTCDICLEVAGDQSKLSTHMWKHKLNHLCYRCGIAYRNKPDITKHLFWKHGTESVLCKKCLQKKWPHVYHFCIPPTEFICEECNASFKRAVALKVHKRLHAGEMPYTCSQCDKKLISKRLLAKHEDAHNQSTLNEGSDNCKVNAVDSSEDLINVEDVDDNLCQLKGTDPNEESRDKVTASEAITESKSKKKKKKEKKNKIVDVYDLPPLNLSSESDSSDGETKETQKDSSEPNDVLVDINEKKQETVTGKSTNVPIDNIDPHEENQTPAPIVDGVWDNFHSYKAELEKRDLKDLSLPNILPSTSSDGVKLQPENEINNLSTEFIMLEHSYCLIPGKPQPQTHIEGEDQGQPDPLSTENPVKSSDGDLKNNKEELPAPRGHSSSIDHPYATLNNSSEGTVTAPDNEASAAPSELISTTVSNPEPLTESQNRSQPTMKKKQKSPKKKKENINSSSSSDSSSDSDSSCGSNCKSNCSCTSNSSSNTSSSSSSDSDSSTPEGRQRALDRRGKKKERIEHKHSKEDNGINLGNSKFKSPGLKVDQNTESLVNIPKTRIEPPIRESDLDTDESSTDEDFYDKYPQSHAKQQMEKNKLMLLASVAPVNNGSVSPLQSASGESNIPPSISKKKIKSKKRKKSITFKKTSKKGSNSQNQSRPSTSSVSTKSAISSSPFFMTSSSQHFTGKTASPLPTPISNIHSDPAGGSGSDNESARISKRKRVRNKFYGYSSGEEDQEKVGTKWKKLDTFTSTQAVSSNVVKSYTPPHKSQKPISTPSQGNFLQKIKGSSGSEDESPTKKEEFTNSTSSSSSSSGSDNETDTKPVVQKEQTEKNDSLYCYCQCPYDEVSEMIACDGQDCTIEWFHFECVGIMVPPKGKWYCPDCRKRRDLM